MTKDPIPVLEVTALLTLTAYNSAAVAPRPILASQMQSSVCYPSDLKCLKLPLVPTEFGTRYGDMGIF